MPYSYTTHTRIPLYANACMHLWLNFFPPSIFNIAKTNFQLADLYYYNQDNDDDDDDDTAQHRSNWQLRLPHTKHWLLYSHLHAG